MKVIRITAIWCMSCLVMRKRYDDLFKSLNIETVIDLDYDEDDVSSYHVGQTLPLIILYQNNQEIKRIVGEKSKKALKEIFEQL